jgi:hypothetical protein
MAFCTSFCSDWIHSQILYSNQHSFRLSINNRPDDWWKEHSPSCFATPKFLFKKAKSYCRSSLLRESFGWIALGLLLYINTFLQGEGWRLIERKHRSTNFSARSAENMADYEVSFLPREMGSNCEEWIAQQTRSWDHAPTRRKETQIFQEILWLNSQLFRRSNSTCIAAPVVHLWEWAVW